MQKQAFWQDFCHFAINILFRYSTEKGQFWGVLGPKKASFGAKKASFGAKKPDFGVAKAKMGRFLNLDPSNRQTGVLGALGAFLSRPLILGV